MLAKVGWRVEIDSHGHYDIIKSSRASSKRDEAIVQGKEERKIYLQKMFTELTQQIFFFLPPYHTGA